MDANNEVGSSCISSFISDQMKLLKSTSVALGTSQLFESSLFSYNQIVTKVRPIFEHPYTIQANKLYRVFTQGQDFKTTANDAVLDLEIFKGIIKASNDHKFK